MYARRNFWFNVVDALGAAITSGLKVTILAADGAATAVYAGPSGSTEVGSTGVISSTAFAALATPGLVSFWTTQSSVDVEIVSEEGAHVKVEGLTGADHRIVLDVNRADAQLIFAKTAAGAELVDAAATFVDFPGTVTIAGENLHAGDRLHVFGQILFADFNSGDTMDLKVLLGTEAILQTTDVTPAANDDTITFDLWVTVDTAGSSGKLKVTGHWWTDLNGTVVDHIVSPTGAAKQVSEDLSGDLVCKAQGDYSAEHADNEAYLIDFAVIKYSNGNV